MKNKIKKFIIILSSIVLIVSLNICITAQSISTATKNEPLHYMGAIPDSPENIKKYLMKEDSANQ